MPKEFSLPVEPASQVLDWMNEYQNDPKLSFMDGSDSKPLHGVSYDVEDIAWLIKNLDNTKHKVFLGLAKRDDGSHTIIVGGIEPITDEKGDVIGSVLLHNTVSQPILEYGVPCPTKCPKGIKEID